MAMAAMVPLVSSSSSSKRIEVKTRIKQALKMAVP
jgi:hypothetical protein